MSKVLFSCFEKLKIYIFWSFAGKIRLGYVSQDRQHSLSWLDHSLCEGKIQTGRGEVSSSFVEPNAPAESAKTSHPGTRGTTAPGGDHPQSGTQDRTRYNCLTRRNDASTSYLSHYKCAATASTTATTSFRFSSTTTLCFTVWHTSRYCYRVCMCV